MSLDERRYLSAVTVVSLIAIFGSAWAEDYLDFFDRGEFALRVQNWKRAVEYFDKAVEANPRFVIGYINRAIAYSKMGQYDKSIEDLKHAVQIDPDRPDVYGLMGLVQEIKKDYPAAIEAYRAALAGEKRPAVWAVIERYIKDLGPKTQKNRP